MPCGWGRSLHHLQPLHLQCEQCWPIKSFVSLIEHQPAQPSTLSSPAIPDWHPTVGGEGDGGGGGGGSGGAGGLGGGGWQTVQAAHLHQPPQSFNLHHAAHDAVMLSPSLPCEQAPGGSGFGGGGGGGEGGGIMQKSHVAHLHHVQWALARACWQKEAHAARAVSPLRKPGHSVKAGDIEASFVHTAACHRTQGKMSFYR